MSVTMFNNPFVRAAGIVAICYVLVNALGWGLHSAITIVESFSAWVRFTLAPHAWQIGVAIAVVYLVFTAMRTSRD